jgi:catechol 2,3-dioxygenase-like lactoylglutathione lyase family enzyme
VPLLNDIQHLTFVTADMQRLIAFYERVFEARVTLDMEEVGCAMLSSRSVLTPSCTPSRFPASSRRNGSRCSSADDSTTSR